MYDVAVIGAGVIGGMIARLLSKYELKLCILEKENDVATGATKANSGIVHAGFDAAQGSLKAQLNVKGSRMMKAVCEELGVRYKNNGSLVVGFDDEDRATLQKLLERGKANGVEGLRIVEKDELRALEPNISPAAVCALYAPTGAIVCPYGLTTAAVGNAMDNGAALYRNFAVCAIERIEGGYSVSSKGGEEIKARFVINCAGIFSDKIAAMAGAGSFSVHPRKGEYILLDREYGDTVSHTIFGTPGKMGKGVLVTPTADGNLLLGPTSKDMEDKDDKATREECFDEIIAKAKRNVDFNPAGKAITSFCGLRAVGDTGDFIINSPREGFINVAGIESPGLSAAPAIAEYVRDMLARGGLNLKEKENYEPRRRSAHRFADASLEEKNRMIKENPAYGRIICRCEGVTEGEILDAIHTNPGAVDLDGIKRRTRAQMGRCQGGFCGPQIIDLLSRELGIPYEKVTKSGGGSFINIQKTKQG